MMDGYPDDIGFFVGKGVGWDLILSNHWEITTRTRAMGSRWKIYVLVRNI